MVHAQKDEYYKALLGLCLEIFYKSFLRRDLCKMTCVTKIPCKRCTSLYWYLEYSCHYVCFNRHCQKCIIIWIIKLIFIRNFFLSLCRKLFISEGGGPCINCSFPEYIYEYIFENVYSWGVPWSSGCSAPHCKPRQSSFRFWSREVMICHRSWFVMMQALGLVDPSNNHIMPNGFDDFSKIGVHHVTRWYVWEEGHMASCDGLQWLYPQARRRQDNGDGNVGHTVLPIKPMWQVWTTGAYHD